MAKQASRSGNRARRGTQRPQPAPRAAGSAARRSNLLLWSGIILVGLITVSLPTVMVIGIGMLPTFVAWICDRSEEKFATFCVGGLNFSGVFPYVMELWTGEHSMRAATELLTNVFSLLVMFGSAGLGWMLFAAVPPVIATFLKVLSERRLAMLRAEQRKLVDEWGEEVRGESDTAANGASAQGPSSGGASAGQAEQAAA